MYFKSKAYGGQDVILAHPDNYDTISMELEQNDALAATVNSRKIVKMGTIYKDENGRAIGLTFNEIDVTDGGDNVAVLIKGTVLVGKLPAIPTKAEAEQMKNIVFLDSGGKAINYT